MAAYKPRVRVVRDRAAERAEFVFASLFEIDSGGVPEAPGQPELVASGLPGSCPRWTLDAHTQVSTQALNSESVRVAILEILLRDAGLYEALRTKAPA